MPPLRASYYHGGADRSLSNTHSFYTPKGDTPKYDDARRWGLLGFNKSIWCRTCLLPIPLTAACEHALELVCPSESVGARVPQPHGI